MINLGIQKALSFMLLIATGFLLRRKFADPIAGSTIRSLVLNVTLPATIFLSTLDINTSLDLIFFPVFAISVNLYLMLVGFLSTLR